MSPARNPVTWSSALVLATFLLYFVFCFAAHLLTSKVERVPLPKIDYPNRQQFDADDVYVFISHVDSDSFCQILKAKLSRLEGEVANIHCIVQETRPIEWDPVAVDNYLKPIASQIGISWFFFGDTDQEHSITLGEFSHAWTIKGRLDQDTWIDESISVFRRMISATSITRSEQVQSQRSYLLSFSVLIENPAEVNLNLNFKQVITEYLQPFLTKIRPVFNTRIDSQLVYFADIADLIHVDDIAGNYLTQAELEDFMGRTKWNVESIHMPSFPALHFLIYIPLAKHSPLLIRSNDGVSTAFSIPRWGGLTIGNSLSKPDPMIDDFSSVMPVVLAQIRMLLGLPNPLWSYSDLTAARQLASEVGVADWEVRLVQRLRLQQNYHDGYDQLHALMRLLDENLQLPVRSHVGNLIEQAVSRLDLCMQNFGSGHRDRAYDLCLDGYSAAHSAFFDETMLPLLYFPDEHVYAVYAPYFLSIFSVTISRAVQFLKHLKGQKTTAASNS